MPGKKYKRIRKKMQARPLQRKLYEVELPDLPRLPFILRYAMEILCVLIVLSFFCCVFSVWFVLPGLFFILLMWWVRNYHPAMRRYIDAIQSRRPLPGPEEPGVTAYNIMHGLSSGNHYRNVPEHLRRKSYFGKCD